MNYIGSKLKLSDSIVAEIKNVVGKLDDKVFCELFAGTGIISRKLKKQVKKVIANDIEYYSYVLIKNYIENHIPIKYLEEFDELNDLKDVKGFIYKNYCLGGSNVRNYFNDANGKRIDAIRIRIEEWYHTKKINKNKYFFLLASLLESSDRVANTASVYGAFLKHIKKSASVPLYLKPALFEINDNQHIAYNEDANILIKKIAGDILYLDPPYNHRQYGANYHILNTIAAYKEFKPTGKTGLPDYYRSEYCVVKKAGEALENVIRNANFKYIFLSYNNEGIIETNKIAEILSKYGSYKLSKFEGYQRFKADKDENRTFFAASTTEYLHILIKNLD